LSADYDGDGDVDVFVAGRAVPDRYPAGAQSHLFRNDDGRLVHAGEMQVGMVTGGVWTDLDNDGDPDLVIATEWGPLRVLRNDSGTLAEATEELGLNDWSGLWQGVASGDLDGDGWLDLVAVNLGLNTRYHASQQEPALLYAGDVNGDGSQDLIEAEYIDGVMWPIREFGMASMQVPELKTRFSTFKAYALAKLSDIYGPALASLQRNEARELGHTVFWNEGGTQFRPQRLPTPAQVMPGYGVAVADLDNDGREDIYFAGNSHSAEPMTMAFDGGVSVWLRGLGDRQFEAVGSQLSGLLVPQDAKGVSVADYDQDGWLDVAVGTNMGPLRLFHNRGVQGRSALRVWLDGPSTNPMAIGARVVVEGTDGVVLAKEVQGGSGYLSQNGRLLVFGLGDAQAKSVTVKWPDGHQSVVDTPDLSQVLKVKR
jgi:hypothetical protein